MVTYPEDWKAVQLKDIGYIQMCRRIFQDQTKKSGQIPFYKIGTFGGNADAYISRELFEQFRNMYPYPEKGDVLLSAAGTVGKTVIFDGREAYFQDSNIVWLKVDESEIDKRFLYYFYKSFPWKALEGTTIGRLYNNIILNTDIQLPPLQEQQAIASVLSDFDEHIDNLTELIEKKKAIRDGALEDLISGKIRVDGFDGEPREYKPIKDVYKRVKGTPITANIMGNISVLNGNIRIFAGGSTECRANAEDLPNAKITNEPIVIVQSRGVIDFVYCDEPCTFKNEMWGYTFPDKDVVKFLFYYLKHNVGHFRNEGSGRSSFSQISLPVTEGYLIPIISTGEQKTIVNILTAMDEEIESIETEKAKMMEIREGAMDDLLTGRVRLNV